MKQTSSRSKRSCPMTAAAASRQTSGLIVLSLVLVSLSLIILPL